LFEYVTFWTGYDDLDIFNLKIYWMNNGGCKASIYNEDAAINKFYEFIDQIVELGEQSHDKPDKVRR